MICHSNYNAEICIVGRCNFNTGIGIHTFALCELLSRNYPVCIFPTEPHLRQGRFILLPNGREIPVCHNLSNVKITIFCDVLWNGSYDFNYSIVPEHDHLKLAFVVFDSSELLPQWVNILNSRFDGALVPSPHLELTLKNSGVTIPIASLPLALDIDDLLTQSVSPKNAVVRFGSIAAFHPRKNNNILIDAFSLAFGDKPDLAELFLHSNLTFNDTLIELKKKIDNDQLKNIIISSHELTPKDKSALVNSIDIFVNCSRGEGYSIGAREALACGKVLVLSEVGGHKDLEGIPGVFLVKPRYTIPARYPEIDNLIAGEQWLVDSEDVAHAMLKAYHFFNSKECDDSINARKNKAADFSFSRLSTSYAEIINPQIRSFRKLATSPPQVSISEEFKKMVTQKLGAHANSLNHINRRIIPAHDGGFFSVFNVFLSHLVWDLQDERCHMVLPDMDVGRLITREGHDNLKSFCYGKPNDKNLWLKFFEPLYGLSEQEFNDETFLYQKASLPEHRCNEDREPLLTYTHAYQLYKSPQFAAIRRQYHKVFMNYITLKPELAEEIDAFTLEHFSNKFLIAAHVRHPSHTVEQPNMSIAFTQDYINQIKQELNKKNFKFEEDNWRVFLATDQDRTIHEFQKAFGSKVIYFNDVRRIKDQEDKKFYQLPAHLRNQEGFQLQHLIAANKDWSTRMGWEVIRDAMVMSRCHILLHIVSNVSTAVSYMNPDIELIFCNPSND